MGALLFLAVIGLPSAYADRSDDKALAKRAVLKVADLPAGWRTTSSDSDEETDEVYEGIPECRAYAAVRKRAQKLPRAEADFARQDAEIGQAVIVYRTAAAAERAFATTKTPESATCFEKGTKELIKRSVTSDPRARDIDDLQVELGELSVEPAGDDQVAFQIVLTLRSKGIELEYYLDAHYVRVGRSVATFSFADTFSPLSGTEDFVSVVVDRLERALGP